MHHNATTEKTRPATRYAREAMGLNGKPRREREQERGKQWQRKDKRGPAPVLH